MIFKKLVPVLTGAFLLQTTIARSNHDQQLRQHRRAFTNCAGLDPNEEGVNCDDELTSTVRAAAAVGAVGDRVNDLDLDSAECKATTETPGTGTGLTDIRFYYAIESDSPVKINEVRVMESVMFVLISTGILWCTMPNNPIDVNNANRMLSDVEHNPRCKYRLAMFNLLQCITRLS